jgi:hypothetical protein
LLIVTEININANVKQRIFITMDKKENVMDKLTRQISELQSLYDKYENNPAEQSITASKIMILTKKLKLWQDLYAAVS